MNKSTITRERLEKIKSWRETYGAGSNVMLPAEEAEELARIALAAMDSEPVATLDVQSGRPDGNKFALVFSSAAHKLPDDVYFLYRHAQPAPVVPQDVLEALQKVARISLDMNDFDGDRRGIADCLGDAEEALIEVVNRRAAMLQTEPVCTCPSGNGSLHWPCPVHPGNSPVIPDGYVMVPREPTKQMILAGQEELESCIDNGFDSDIDGNRYDYTDIVPDAPHRVFMAMLAAALQEGK